MRYNIKVEPQALSDIQEITDWYNEKRSGLGKHFQTTVIKQIDGLSKSLMQAPYATKKSVACW